jgi:hypothetical protein
MRRREVQRSRNLSFRLSLLYTRAAFYPPLETIVHPILPNGVDELTMFADYRVCLFPVALAPHSTGMSLSCPFCPCPAGP